MIYTTLGFIKLMQAWYFWFDTWIPITFWKGLCQQATAVVKGLMKINSFRPSTAFIHSARLRVRIPSGAQEKLSKPKAEKGCADSLSVCPTEPPCVYACTRKTMYARERSCSPCQSLVDDGNQKITSMQLYPRRRNDWLPKWRRN